jgi:hypothetical protein
VKFVKGTKKPPLDAGEFGKFKARYVESRCAVQLELISG